MTKIPFRLLCTAALISIAPTANAADQRDTAITIYSKAQPGAIDPNMYRPVNGQQPAYYGASVPGYAIVREQREVNLSGKKTEIKFDDVAGLIDPTTVQFKSLTDPKGTKVGEQNFQFDLVSQQKLMEKYIDKKITVEKYQYGASPQESVEGVLLSTQGGLTLKTNDGQIKTINGYQSVNFPELPGGLITKPTLVWDIYTDKPGSHKAEVSYETQGVTWWADYNLTYNEGKDANSGTVDFGSWVSIINQSGATYDNAKLKLIAGDVQKTQPGVFAGAPATRGMAMESSMVDGTAAPSFAEKEFFEYHMYTLSQLVNLPQNSTKQMELIPAVMGVPVEKMMVFNAVESQYWNWGGVYYDQSYGLTGEKRKVDVLLKLKNAKENGLGVALPAGRMRVNQRDNSDGSLEFIGENVIDHTPRNEEITIKLGSAFDVVGERKQLDYRLDTNARFADEEIEIKLRNQKKQAVKVKTIESMYRATGWKILSADAEYSKDNAHQISFITSIEPEKEAVIRYKVRYTW